MSAVLVEGATKFNQLGNDTGRVNITVNGAGGVTCMFIEHGKQTLNVKLTASVRLALITALVEAGPPLED